MREKAPLDSNIPSEADNNQTRTVSLPVKSSDSDKVEKPAQIED